MTGPFYPPKHTPARFAYRYLSGRPLDGRPGHPYLRPGAGRWPGWKRQAYRLGVPLATLVVYTYPGQVAATVGTAAALAGWQAKRRYSRRRFAGEYVTPVLSAIAPAVGLPDGRGVRLYVDPALGNLTPRLATPLSPAEKAARRWYGERVEPLLRWTPEHLQRALWAAQRLAKPATDRLAAFRRPRAEQLGPRIELTVAVSYLTREQRQLISSIVSSKIPVADLVESWNMVGTKVSARWTVRRRPPSQVGLERLEAAFDGLSEWEYFVGQGAGDKPVVVSLRDDSPHIAVSAGSGAGKSVLAQLVAVQVLRRGGRVTILDRKGSHRWALGVDGVDYCTRPEEMHRALIRLAQLADERNTLALHEADDWDPGVRHLVIAEELNATIGQLANFWAEAREKGDPKKSPAISALADILFMGRSAKVNVLAVAQMLTARTLGGPEARENFGVRCLARYTVNAWKMLVPEASMPRPSRTLGRWQLVVGGTATEVQVAFLTAAQARLFASLADVHDGLDGALSSDVPGDGDMLTLRDAVDAGVLPWTYEAAKKRLQRGGGKLPTRRGSRGSAATYSRSDLAEWAGSV